MDGDLGDATLGLLTGLGLIVAIGAQNAFVLRQGLRREHVGPVVAVCALADLLLIGAGIAGLGPAVTSSPVVLQVARWVGAAFLLVLAVQAALRARRPQALEAAATTRPGRRATVLTALALTFLNPHVYLDTVVLLGSVAHQQGDGRWAFGAGAGVGSLVWFTALGFGATRLAPVLARPRAWQVVDGLIAVVMAGIAVTLLLPAG